MLKDRVTIQTKEDVYHDVPASVQRNKIFVFRTDIPIQPGDYVTRKLPSGVDEVYIVDDPGFYSGGGGIPDSYQMKVSRSDAPRRETPGSSIVYNIIGANARFNINSIDQSVNVVNSASEEMFEALRDAIRTSVDDERVCRSLLDGATELESRVGKPGFLQSYQQFIALAADHMSIIAPFIPALTQLLTSA